MLSQISVRPLTLRPIKLTIPIFNPFSVRWGSDGPKKCRAELIQSAFLWVQFYETQLQIHRTFALREPPDPDLSASSMIICKNASKQCITVIESAKDVMMVPFHCFLLIVRLIPAPSYGCSTSSNIFRSPCSHRRYSFS